MNAAWLSVYPNMLEHADEFVFLPGPEGVENRIYSFHDLQSV
jgi:hypothetical protein